SCAGWMPSTGSSRRAAAGVGSGTAAGVAGAGVPGSDGGGGVVARLTATGTASASGLADSAVPRNRKYTTLAPTRTPARNSSTPFTGSPLQFGGHARRHRPGDRACIPVGQADAAMRLGLADGRGFGGAVDSVMLLRQVDPDHADRVVRPGLDGGPGMRAVGIP